MHHLLGCPDVVSIKGAYEDAVAVHVVMELCQGGELFDRIVKRGHFTERNAAKLARTIVSVVESCHSRGVMHRDLKPENFLFVDQHEDSTLMAIDFGMSVFFKPGDIFTEVVGTPNYMAPDCYGPEADVWSAGVIIYILLCGWPPFWAEESEEKIFEEVLHGELDFTSDPWPSISESAKYLVRKMLVRDPRKRITAHEVLNHPWIQVNGDAPNKPLDSAVLSRLNQFSTMNKLKKMALRVIAENLSEEEISVLKDLFNMIDTDNSGHITFEKLKVGLKMFGANLSESEAFDLMQVADVDNSGTIDYEEFITATLHTNQVCTEDHLIAAFSYFDEDGSGYITQDELQQACKEFGMENVHLDEMIHEADQNNDGKIDYNEFVAMMKRGNVDLGRFISLNKLTSSDLGSQDTPTSLDLGSQIMPTLAERLKLPKLQPISIEGMDLGSEGGSAGPKVEEKKAEKTAFDVKLEKFDAAAKIKVIKEVRTFTNLGLKEAKDLVEKVPVVLKQGITKEEANDIIEN